MSACYSRGLCLGVDRGGFGHARGGIFGFRGKDLSLANRASSEPTCVSLESSVLESVSVDHTYHLSHARMLDLIHVPWQVDWGQCTIMSSTFRSSSISAAMAMVLPGAI